jgi:hypothetical protein
MTPEQRHLRAQVAANTRWSRPMARQDQADAARAAMHRCLERELDPLSQLPPDERDRRVRSAARALSARLNLAKASKQKRMLSGVNVASRTPACTPAGARSISSRTAPPWCTGPSAACVGGSLATRFPCYPAHAVKASGSISVTHCGLQRPVHGFDSRLRLTLTL